MPQFKLGQFVSVKRHVGEPGVDQPSQYSLSHAPHGKWLRISVRHEGGEDVPAGRVSTQMHDGVEVGSIVDVSAPMGEFCLDREKATPVVLVSGGVGITPMMSMLSTLVAEGSQCRVAFVHACRKAVSMRSGNGLLRG